MSTKPMKPLPNGNQQVQVDISKAENVKCEECGNYSFIETYFIKRISAIMSPNGQEMIAPVQVFSCGNCGAVEKSMMRGIEGVGEEQ